MEDNDLQRSEDLVDDWHQSPLGEYLMQHEEGLFADKVVNIFGFNAVQLGFLHMDLLSNSRITFNIKADIEQGDMRCDSAQLPLSANSIDLLLLPHGLDISANPQQTLREAERVLVPEGYVILTGFNPFSLWGLFRILKRRQYFPWNVNFLSLIRIKDWLALLGFEVSYLRTCCYAPPIMSRKWLGRFSGVDKFGRQFLPLMGGIYFIVAQKKVVGMRLIKPNWQKNKFKAQFIPTPTQKEDMQK